MSISSISVVVATCNRQETLPKVIEGLLTQRLKQPIDYEIIIVDNNSTDQTSSIIKGFIPQSSGQLKYFKQELRGKSNALNLGIQKSRGEIIAFTDDDVELEELWVSCLIECFEKYHCDGVGGRVLPIYPPNTPSWAKKNPHQMAGAVVIFNLGEETMAVKKESPSFIGANWAFKRNIFKDYGLFRIDLGPGAYCLGEDLEFYQRLIQNNKILYYCPQALIWHPVDLKRLSLKHMAQWHISLGRFDAKCENAARTPNLILIGGVPRYIIKGIIGDFLLMLLNIFNPFKFRNYFRAFFRKWGMIQEYRTIKQRSS